MRFETVLPSARLKPYIRRFVISGHNREQVYKVFPEPGLVLGFQYKGQLARVNGDATIALSSAGITGLADSFRVFRNTADTGTILVYLTEAGLMHFSFCPAHELFNQSISLDNLFPAAAVRQVQEQLMAAGTDRERIGIVEAFLLSRLNGRPADPLIQEAIGLIGDSNGSIRIGELPGRLYISQTALEQRFKKQVGVTPKKFASIIRFHAVLRNLAHDCPPAGRAYAHHFFDQAHFIRDFRQYTGETPEQFRSRLSNP